MRTSACSILLRLLSGQVLVWMESELRVWHHSQSHQKHRRSHLEWTWISTFYIHIIFCTCKCVIPTDQLVQSNNLGCSGVVSWAIKWTKAGHHPIGILKDNPSKRSQRLSSFLKFSYLRLEAMTLVVATVPRSLTSDRTGNWKNQKKWKAAIALYMSKCPGSGLKVSGVGGGWVLVVCKPLVNSLRQAIHTHTGFDLFVAS